MLSRLKFNLGTDRGVGFGLTHLVQAVLADDWVNERLRIKSTGPVRKVKISELERAKSICNVTFSNW